MLKAFQNSSKDKLMRKRARAGWIFILPLILGVLLIFIPNLIQTFRFSISNINITGEGYFLDYKGFEFYKAAFREDPEFIPALISNFRTLIIRIPIIIIYSLFISTLLNQKFHGRVFARIIFFVPVILSAGVISFVDADAMSQVSSGQSFDIGLASGASGFDGIFNMLSSLNFPAPLIDIITESISQIYIIATASGLQIFIFLAGLQEIPESLYEAASIEGCSKWELFWKITFPMISPQIAINMIYTISEAASGENWLLFYARRLAFQENQYALATAMNIIYLLCLGALIAILFAVVRKLTPRTN